MLLYLCFLVLTGACLMLALKKKKVFYLAVPFLSLFLYGIVQIILVPVPLIDTVKFIFSLS